ncbi:MAG TPA: HAMP domain-containing sensor histidine kinase [Candidatus Saccharimonadales bacterium]|nr:HAMP domain-containing sensor histidine kinase [Candidatus Saccharimonadales bacterium]
MTPLAISLLSLYFVEVVGFFVIAALVILRQKTALHVGFTVFALLVGVWQGLQFASQLVSAHHAIAGALLQASVFFSGPLAASFLIFTLIRTNQEPHYFRYNVLGVVAGTVSLFSSNVRNIKIDYLGIGVPKLDVWYATVLAFGAFSVAYGVLTISMHFRRTTDKVERRRDGIMLVSMLIVGLMIIFASFSTSEFSQSVLAQHVLPAAVLFAMVTFAYVIYRGLFDIHFFVVRALAYLATIFMLTVFCVIPVVLIAAYFLDINIDGKLPFVAFGSVIALYFLLYLRKLFDQLTMRIFFRQFYDPQDVLYSLSNILARTIDLAILTKSSTQLLKRVLKADTLQFVLVNNTDAAGEEIIKEGRRLPFARSNAVIIDDLDSKRHPEMKFFRHQKIAVVVRLHTAHEELGYMFLGYKQSGEAFGGREVRLLNTAADELALAIQNALRFQEIQSFNLTLQQKIDEATAKLRQTNHKLRALDEAKDEFISMASHQMRTPLTSVKGYISMVLEGYGGTLKPDQRKLLGEAYNSAQRMVYLIADFLNVSRIRTGKFEVETTPVRLTDLIRTEINQLEATAKNRGLTLVYDEPEHFPELMLDEEKTRQVIMNFIDNAIYYTQPGGTITVTLTTTNNEVSFRVTDTGIGVPKTEQHQLFSKFFRASNALKMRPDGTGIGLFLAKRIIALQEGAIIFESKEGKGSTFGFRFPRRKVVESKD